MIEMLLSNPNASASYGLIPAAAVRSSKFVDLLLKRGADPDFRCSGSVVLGDCRVVADAVPSETALMGAIASPPGLWWAIRRRAAMGMPNPPTMMDLMLMEESYLEEGVDLIRVVRALLHGGADLDAEDQYGQTALMRASGIGFGKVARILLDAGADVNIVDRSGLSAMSFASRELSSGQERLLFNRRLSEVAALLQDAGAAD